MAMRGDALVDLFLVSPRVISLRAWGLGPEGVGLALGPVVIRGLFIYGRCRLHEFGNDTAGS